MQLIGAKSVSTMLVLIVSIGYIINNKPVVKTEYEIKETPKGKLGFLEYFIQPADKESQ